MTAEETEAAYQEANRLVAGITNALQLVLGTILADVTEVAETKEHKAVGKADVPTATVPAVVPPVMPTVPLPSRPASVAPKRVPQKVISPR